MNKKQIILTASTLIIAAAGVFAGIKKSVPSAIYFKSTGGACKTFIASNSLANFTNTAGTVQAAILTEVAGSQNTLWTTNGCSTHKAYFKN